MKSFLLGATWGLVFLASLYAGRALANLNTTAPKEKRDGGSKVQD